MMMNLYMVVYDSSLSALKAEAEGSLWVWDLPGLQTEFRENLNSTKSCPKQTNKQTNKNKKKDQDDELENVDNNYRLKHLLSKCFLNNSGQEAIFVNSIKYLKKKCSSS